MHRAMTTMLSAIVLVVAACGGGASESPDTAQANGFDAESYFAGRTIRVIVTHSAGGGTDLYARFIANEIGSHIPGEPRVTVTNTSGVGGMTTIFDAPEADLVLGVTSQGAALYTAALDPAATFDASKIRMIGAVGPGPRSMGTFGEVVDAYPSLNDATGKDGPPFKLAQTIGSPADIVSDAFAFAWLCENIDLPCETVSVADDDSVDLSLIIERGELNTIFTTTRTMVREYFDRLMVGDARIAVEYAIDDTTTLELPEQIKVPNILDVLPAALHEEYNRILPMISSGSVGNNYWVGPSMPDEALEVLRQAYTDVLSDPAMLDQLRSIVIGGDDDAGFTYEFEPLSGADAQKLFLESSGTFTKNLDFYKGLQNTYYEKYWK